MALDFKDDKSKARLNILKHRVSFQEAATIFFDPNSLTEIDNEHGGVGDERFITVGRSTKGRLLFVVHNEGDGQIRIISARVASPTQRAFYEEG